MYSTKIKDLTRRRFVKGVAGAAFCCAWLPLEGLSASAKTSEHNSEDGKEIQETDTGKEHLVAVCGTYCGACFAYIAKNSQDEQIKSKLQKEFSSGPMKLNMESFGCDGCLSDGKIAAHCQSCAMRKCAASKQNVTRCSDCTDFPCSLITNFNNDGRLHHAELLENLRQIRKMGIQKWAKYEEERWRCPQCGLPMSWYDRECTGCGTPRSKRLFPLAQN